MTQVRQEYLPPIRPFFSHGPVRQHEFVPRGPRIPVRHHRPRHHVPMRAHYGVSGPTYLQDRYLQNRHFRPINRYNPGISNTGVSKKSRHPTIPWNSGDAIPAGTAFKLDLAERERRARLRRIPPPSPMSVGWERWSYHVHRGDGTPDSPTIFWLHESRDPKRRAACNDIARKVALDTKCGYIWIMREDHNVSYEYEEGEKVSDDLVKADPHLTVRYGNRFGHCNLHGHLYIEYHRAYPSDLARRRVIVEDGDDRIVQLFHWTSQRKPGPLSRPENFPPAVGNQMRRQDRMQRITASRQRALGSPCR